MKNITVILDHLLIAKKLFAYMVVDHDYKTVSFSNGVQKFFSEELQKGVDIVEYIPDFVGMEREIGLLFSKNGSYTFLEYTEKNGHYVNIYIRFYQKERIILFFHDVTEEVRQFHLHLQNANMSRLELHQVKQENESYKSFITDQSKYASMGEMLGSITHQWRQPLHRINSNISVLYEIVNDAQIDRKFMSSKLKNIQEHVLYLSQTIEDFANFLHPTKQKEMFSLNETIEQVLKFMESRLKNVQVRTAAKKDTMLYSFKRELYQVFLIIMNNAIDIFESRDVPNPFIEITCAEENGVIVISIEDNGGGIQKEHLSRVFVPYFSTKSSTTGRGLGLYIANMIMEQSIGGALSVKNTESGASFDIVLTQAINTNHL